MSRSSDDHPSSPATGSTATPGASSDSASTATPGPPSAAGALEPYGAMVRLKPIAGELDPLYFLPTLLEEIARLCLDQGASVLGHLKCLLRTNEGHVSCNLTTVQSGAACRERDVGVIPTETEVELDLVVLVYGLSATAIDELVGETLESLLSPLGVAWAKSASFHA